MVETGILSLSLTGQTDGQKTTQSWTWIGFIHGLDWVGLGWIGLGPISWLKNLDWIGLGQKFCPLHRFSEDGSAFVQCFLSLKRIFGFYAD